MLIPVRAKRVKCGQVTTNHNLIRCQFLHVSSENIILNFEACSNNMYTNSSTVK